MRLLEVIVSPKDKIRDPAGRFDMGDSAPYSITGYWELPLT